MGRGPQSNTWKHRHWADLSWRDRVEKFGWYERCKTIFFMQNQCKKELTLKKHHPKAHEGKYRTIISHADDTDEPYWSGEVEDIAELDFLRLSSGRFCASCLLVRRILLTRLRLSNVDLCYCFQIPKEGNMQRNWVNFNFQTLDFPCVWMKLAWYRSTPGLVRIPSRKGKSVRPQAECHPSDDHQWDGNIPQ